MTAETGRLLADAFLDRVADVVLDRRRAARSPGQSAGEAGPKPEPPRGGREARDLARAESLIAGLVSAVLVRIDINAVLDRIDVQRVIERVDLDAVLAEVDLDALVERVDVDAVVERIDIGAVTTEALDAVDLGEVVRDSTASLGTDAVEEFREQAMIADDRISRLVDRVLGRTGERDTTISREGSRW